MRNGPPRHKRGKKAFTGWVVIASVIFLFGSQSFAQPICDKQSLNAELASHGANEVVVFSDLRTVRLLQGRVVDTNGVPIGTAVIDIFPANGLTKKIPASRFVTEEKRIESYRVDQNGAFCIEGLPDGDYVLRFGTQSFGYKNTLIKVRTKKSGARKAINVELWPGT